MTAKVISVVAALTRDVDGRVLLVCKRGTSKDLDLTAIAVKQFDDKNWEHAMAGRVPWR